VADGVGHRVAGGAELNRVAGGAELNRVAGGASNLPAAVASADRPSVTRRRVTKVDHSGHTVHSRQNARKLS